MTRYWRFFSVFVCDWGGIDDLFLLETNLGRQFAWLVGIVVFWVICHVARCIFWRKILLIKRTFCFDAPRLYSVCCCQCYSQYKVGRRCRRRRRVCRLMSGMRSGRAAQTSYAYLHDQHCCCVGSSTLTSFVGYNWKRAFFLAQRSTFRFCYINDRQKIVRSFSRATVTRVVVKLIWLFDGKQVWAHRKVKIM